ncbi:hypothetical protein QR680_010500 [Steinernema hermaphroditum]|uniref:Nuclear condensin complex subunit 3 C-terminal domain-containing protein n=1 Tax=Steinernema hermaphroditum TaxID=289476 RepID=A0AA39IR38_9BILA|nr:hypothetical protein QR680_010500 [Steinernema hermaphroditum]
MSGVEEDQSDEFVSCDEFPQSEDGDEEPQPQSSDDETDVGVPELDLNEELTDAVIKKFRQRIVDELKDAYRGEGSSELIHAVNSITDIYSRAFQHRAGRRFVQLLLMDLERRLSFLIDNDHYLVGRLRSLSVIARFATGLVHKEPTHSDVLEFLVNFIKKNEYNASSASRALACYLAGEILVSSVGAPIVKQLQVSDVNIEEEEEEEEYPVCISLDAFTKVYSVLVTRSKDKYPNVRKEAIRAIGHVQDRDIWGDYHELVDVQPYIICIRCIKDESADVRTIAIKSLLISERDRVRDLVFIAVNDPDWNVQKEAFTRICQDLHILAFSKEERMSLLKTVCHHEEVMMREVAIKLITSWATQICREIQKEGVDPDGDLGKDIPISLYARTPFYILSYLDIVGHTELCQTVMVHLFYIASLRYPDISSTQSYALLIKDEEEVLNRHNFESIMDNKLSLTEIAHMIFFWRIFAIYCQRASKNAAEWTEVSHQLLPTMRQFSEFVTTFVSFIGDKREGESREPLKLFSIMELLKIPKLLERDVVGTASWRNLLSYMLTTTALPIYKKLIDQCVCDLFAFHYPKPVDTMSGIAEVCDATSLLIARDASPNGNIDGTISLAQHGHPNYQPGLEDMEASPVLEAQGPTLTHCLMIVDAMMRTGRISKMEGALVSGIYENFIEKGAVSRNAEDRRYALRCFAVMCMHNDKAIRLKFPVLHMALQVELPENKVVAVEGISDIIMRWSYKKICDLFRLFEYGGRRLSLAEIFSEMLGEPHLEKTRVPDAVAKALMKWIMAEECDEWRIPLGHLLIFWARPDTYARKSERRQTIGQFLKDYAAKNRQSKNAETRSPRAAVDPDGLADKIVELTNENDDDPLTAKKKKGSKQSTPVPTGPSVHIELMGMVLNHLFRNPGEKYIATFARVLSMLNMEGLQPEMASKCDWSELLKEILEEMDQDETKAIKLLRSFFRNFESRMRSSVVTRRRQPARKAAAGLRTRQRATVSASRSDEPTTTTSSVHSSTASSPTPLDCTELAASLPTIDEEPSTRTRGAKKVAPPTEVNGRAKKGAATSKIPVRTTRSRRGEAEQEKGGRDDAAEAVSDLAAGVVRLQLTGTRRPLRESNRTVTAAKSGVTKSSLSKRTTPSNPSEAEMQNSTTEFILPSDDDDDEFVTRRPRRQKAPATTHQYHTRGSRKPVAAPSENDD